MGTGYTRNDTSNNIADGNIINAADLDGEFDAIESAMGTSGHTHDGTSAEGGPVTVLGPVQDFVASATEIKPKTTNTLDIGTSGLLFKDMFLDGVATVGSIKIDNAGTIGSASDGDAIAISSSGVVSFSQNTIGKTGSGYVLSLQTSDTTIEATNVLGKIEFSAPDEASGTDAILVGASIEALAEDTFDSSTNSTALVFKTNTTGAATERMRLTSAGDLHLLDNRKAIFGAGSDLQIYHDGSNSWIKDEGTGVLAITTNGNGIGFYDPTGTEPMLFATKDNAVDLYFNGAKKLATTSTGISVTGDATFADNGKAIFGASGDLQIYHDGSNSYIKDLGTGDLLLSGNTGVQIQSDAGENMITTAANGAVSLFYDASTKLATTSTGVDITGTLTSDGLNLDGNIQGDDGQNMLVSAGEGSGDKLDLRAGDDVRIWVDGANTHQKAAEFAANGDISFYEDTGTTPALTWDASAQSLNVDGPITSDGLTVDGDGSFTGDFEISGLSPKIFLNETDTTDVNTRIRNASGNLQIQTVNNSDASPVTRFNIDHSTGDISFYEDTGATPKFFWDASAESLGIGTSSPDAALHINTGTTNTVAIFQSTDSSTELKFIDSVGSTQLRSIDGELAFRIGGDGGATTNTTEAMRIDSRGMLGLGSTPPTDAHATWSQFFIGEKGSVISEKSGSGGLYGLWLTDNSYVDNDTGSFSYRTTDEASSINLEAGNTVFRYAASGTAGAALTWSESMRIDSSGNVGINTTTPSSYTANGNNLVVADVNVGITLASTSTVGSGALYFADGTSGSQAYRGIINYLHSSDAMGFHTGAAEAMRIDSSGTLLVGKTSNDDTTTGLVVNGNGLTKIVRSSGTANANTVLQLNRRTTDGDIARFQKDGTTVGSIGANGGDIYVGNSDVTLSFNDVADLIAPTGTNGATRDGLIDLGNGGNRFDDIFATNGTIQTSDRNEKQDIEELTDAEQRVAVAAKGLLRKFRWRDAVEAKGDEARTHFGIIAQDLQAAFAAEGLDAGDYAMFISSTWTDEETGEERTRMGVRYSELLAFIIAAI